MTEAKITLVGPGHGAFIAPEPRVSSRLKIPIGKLADDIALAYDGTPEFASYTKDYWLTWPKLVLAAVHADLYVEYHNPSLCSTCGDALGSDPYCLEHGELT